MWPSLSKTKRDKDALVAVADLALNPTPENARRAGRKLRQARGESTIGDLFFWD